MSLLWLLMFTMVRFNVSTVAVNVYHGDMQCLHFWLFMFTMVRFNISNVDINV